MLDIKKYQAMSGYVSREIAGEMLLVPIGEQTQELNGIIHLNETSMFLWELLKSPQSIDDLIEALKTEFITEEVNLKNDIKEFIEMMLEASLIKEVI